MTPLSIIFAGSGEFGGPTLRSLVAAGHRITESSPSQTALPGKGGTWHPTPIAILAEELSLPVLKTANINTEPSANIPPADLMVVIAFGQKISPPVVNAHGWGASISTHPACLAIAVRPLSTGRS